MIRRPDRTEAVVTGVAAVVLLLALVVQPVGDALFGVAFWMLEVVSRILDRPTSRVVGGYVVFALLATALEVLGPAHRRRWGERLWVVPCFLALLGMGYVAALAAKLVPLRLVLAAAALAGGAWLGRRSAGEPAGAMAPAITAFVVLHLLVEGAAGHILTPWLHAFAVELAQGSVAAPAGWAVFGGVLGAGVAAMAWAGRASIAAVAGLLAVGTAALVVSPGGGPTVLALLAAAAFGWGLGARGREWVPWGHWDLRVVAERLLPLGVAGLCAIGAHHLERYWRCEPAWGEGIALLGRDDGTFDLAVPGDGDRLVVSRREPQEIAVFDLTGGPTQRLPTRRDRDTVFDRTEPETLLAQGDAGVLVLLASSDSEEGNELARLDLRTGALQPVGGRAGRGISDLVADDAGRTWLSSEFDGRLVQIDAGGNEQRRIDVGRAETNKILVAGDVAWSAGLWMDGFVRRIDLQAGRQVAARYLGTHQWDLARSGSLRRLYVPRLTDGELVVLDDEGLDVVGRWSTGFGVRPVEASPDGATVYTGNQYSGDVVAWNAQTGERRWTRWIGGQIKSLRVDGRGRVFAGSTCGVFELTP